jgi:lipopolysaccharide transport system permease protein
MTSTINCSADEERGSLHPVCAERSQFAGDCISTVIAPTASWRFVDLRELWKYRELLYFLTWRDLKVRYKQTALGAGWAILQPLIAMVVFTVFFGRFGGMAERVNGPYTVFVLSALLPWTFFANTVTQGALSLLANGQMVSKVYFPRLLVPFSAACGNLVDLVVALLASFGILLYQGFAPRPGFLALPFLIADAIVAAIGVATLLAALVVEYRDFRQVIPFVMQIWMFVSPVIFPMDVIPQKWRTLYALNPIVGVISGFRSALMGQAFCWFEITVSLLSAVAILLVALVYFSRVERRLADII